MDQFQTESPTTKPTWDVEKTKISDVLSKSYEIKPETREEKDILVAAKGLHDRTRVQAQAFLDSPYQNFADNYFNQIAGKAFQINTAMNPKIGDSMPRYEDIADQASQEIIANLADSYIHAEELKFSGLSEIAESGNKKWEHLTNSQKDFLDLVDNFDLELKMAREEGSGGTQWLNGLRGIQAKYHNKLRFLNHEAYEKMPNGGLVVNGVRQKTEDDTQYEKGLNEKVNDIVMNLINDMDTAFPSINQHQWLDKLKAVQGSFIKFLEQRGISRFIPKVGQAFDPKLPMTAVSGKGTKIRRVVQGGFIDSTGKTKREAFVEVGN